MRYSLSFGGRTGLGAGRIIVDAYVIRYSLDLWSNFTYFLDFPVEGDQFQQSDRRTIYGVLDQDSELLFIGDAGTTEASRPSTRRGIEWLNYYRPLPWLLIDAEIAFTHARFDDDDPAGDYIPGAWERMAQIGVTIENLGRWSGSIQTRYFGSRPLIEDNSVRSDSTTTFMSYDQIVRRKINAPAMAL